MERSSVAYEEYSEVNHAFTAFMLFHMERDSTAFSRKIFQSGYISCKIVGKVG